MNRRFFWGGQPRSQGVCVGGGGSVLGLNKSTNGVGRHASDNLLIS